MSDIFISYAEQDQKLATQIAEMLEEDAYTTWYYKRDVLPDQSYVAQVFQITL